jgi:hypothetical protein
LATPFGSFYEKAGELEWRLALWERIIKAALDGTDDEIDLTDYDRFNLASAGQSTITRWPQLQWYAAHNARMAKGSNPIEDYRNGIQSFNFLVRFLNKSPNRVDEFNPDVELWKECIGREPKLAAPYDRDLRAPTKKVFFLILKLSKTVSRNK